MSRSVWQTAVAAIFTSASPSRGAGRARSTISNFLGPRRMATRDSLFESTLVLRTGRATISLTRAGFFRRRTMQLDKGRPIDAPYAWKGADLQSRTDWLRPFSAAE